MKRMMILLVLLFTAHAFADQKGTDIMKKVNEQAAGGGDTQTIKATMAIVRSKGKPEIKEFTIVSKRTGDVTRSRSTFTKPRRIEFLAWSSPKETSQWIKLSNGSVRKIAASDQSGEFVDSHFYYEDLGDNRMENFRYTYKGDAKVKNENCYMVESVRVKGASVYTKVHIYVRKSDYFVIKVDMFEKQGHTKTLTNEHIERIQGVLVPKKVVMERVDGSGKTIIYMQDVNFNKSIPDSFFSKESL